MSGDDVMGYVKIDLFHSEREHKDILRYSGALTFDGDQKQNSDQMVQNCQTSEKQICINLINFL